jgi:hypothetical protein
MCVLTFTFTVYAIPSTCTQNENLENNIFAILWGGLKKFDFDISKWHFFLFKRRATIILMSAILYMCTYRGLSFEKKSFDFKKRCTESRLQFIKEQSVVFLTLILLRSLQIHFTRKMNTVGSSPWFIIVYDETKSKFYAFRVQYTGNNWQDNP